MKPDFQYSKDDFEPHGFTVFPIANTYDNPFLPKSKYQGTYVGVRTEPKIKRNSQCTCGSGLKYKKCCNK